MKFTVSDLKRISLTVPLLNYRERTRWLATLRRRQPGFCELVDWVGEDPRCADACRFCTIFCAVALRQAEDLAGNCLPTLPAMEIHEAASLIRRDQVSQVGRGACGYGQRLRRHALKGWSFDEDDTDWLCTMISAFLFLVERSLTVPRRGHVHPT